MKNFCEDLFLFLFFFGDRLKNFCEDLFFFIWRALALVSLASSIPVLGLESVCPRKGCPWPWPWIFFVSLALASSLVSSTPPLAFTSADLRILLVYVRNSDSHFTFYFCTCVFDGTVSHSPARLNRIVFQSFILNSLLSEAIYIVGECHATQH